MQAVTAISPYGTTQASEAYAPYINELPAALAAVQANLDVAGALPSVTGATAVRNALQEAVTMVAGGMDAADALAACVATSNEALAE